MSITLQTLKANGEIANPAISLNGGQATVIKAQSGERFQLTDDATGFAPENIEVQRVGNDLFVAFEGQTIDQPGLIIQDYYTTAGNATDNLLIGLHENGTIYPYVPETAQASAAIHQLAEGVVATQAIGGAVVASAAAIPLWPLALIPLAGLAALGGGGGGDDKPALPKASISGLEKVNEGVGTVEYTVALDKPATEDVTIKYTITPNDPTSIDDFTKDTPMTGEVKIPKGESTATILVGIENDDLFEGEESYTVKISDPTNAAIGKDSVTTVIIDDGTGTTDGRDPENPANKDPNGNFTPKESKLKDDDRPTVSIKVAENQALVNAADDRLSASVNEGVKQVKYVIELDKVSEKNTTVTYTVANGDNDPKTDAKDFGEKGLRTETITIKAGETKAEILVDIANDDEYESENGGEEYKVTISNPVNAILGNDKVTTTIWDDGTTNGKIPGTNPPADPNKPDAAPHDTDDDRGLTLSISGPAAVNEAVGKVTYTVTLNKVNNTADTTVDVILKHGITDAKDFSPNIADGEIVKTVTIPKGSTTLTVDFDLGIHNDDIFEGKEDYTVTLVNPKNAVIDKNKGSVTTVIWDDGTTNGIDPADPNNPDNPSNVYDDRPTVSIEGPSSVNEGIGQVKYTITLDKTSEVDTQITYTVANGDKNPTNQDDFGKNGLRTETITIKAGETKAEILVDIANDDEYESANGGEEYIVRIDKAEGVKTENGETIKKELKYGNKSVTTEIWDDGTTDGKTPGKNPPADPKNPDATPHDTDDDRASQANLNGDGVSIVEGTNKTGNFSINFLNKNGQIDSDAKLQSLELKNKDGNTIMVGVNKLLNASDTYPIEIKLPFDNGAGEATLKITGFKDGVVSYDYSSPAQTHKNQDDLRSLVQLSATSTQGKTIDLTDTLTFSVKDTGPTAKPDEVNVDENATIEGNVIAGTHKDALGKDVLDTKATDTSTDGGLKVISVSSKDNGTSGVMGEKLEGKHGTLTLNSDGSYTYEATDDSLIEGEKVKDIFNYTIQDKDGSTSDTTLTVNVTGKDDPAVIKVLSYSGLNLSDSSDTSGILRARINDKDNEEYYLTSYGSSKELAKGETITGYYGTYQVSTDPITNKNDKTTNYEFNYTYDPKNVVIEALKNGLDLVVHDHLNVKAINVTESYASLGTALYNKGADKLSESNGNDVYATSKDLDRDINTHDGDDVVVINTAANKTIALGEGNDYFYAKGNIQGTTIDGGNGNNLFTLYGEATNGSKIIGGTGKDVLILGADTKIDGENLSIKGIDVIDLRNGVATAESTTSTVSTDNTKNTVTITGEALAANGINTVQLFRSSQDTVDLEGFTRDTDKDGNQTNSYSYTAQNGQTYTIVDELNIGINIV